MADTAQPQTYITRHTLIHGEPGKEPVEYPAGSEFSHPDEALIKQLRRTHTLALPNELQTAEQTAQRMAALEAELESTRAALEAEREQAARDRAAMIQEDAEAEAAKKSTPKKAAQ